MARMVLGKAAIRLRVRSPPGTGAQIRSQFMQLDGAASHFHPDENLAGRQSHEQIKLDPGSVMLRFSRFQGDMVSEPATLEHQARGGRELADIFPQNPPGFLREDSVRRGGFVRGRQQFALHSAMAVDLEKIFVYSAGKKFVFPRGEGRPNPEAGMEFIVQPGFELSGQRRRDGSCNLSCCRVAAVGV